MTGSSPFGVLAVLVSWVALLLVMAFRTNSETREALSNDGHRADWSRALASLCAGAIFGTTIEGKEGRGPRG